MVVPAAAHGPIRKKLLTTPPPGVEVPVTKPTPGPVPVHVTASAPPLRALTAEATAIVLATEARTETFDGDRLQVHRLRVERVLAGRLDEAEPGLVEIRGDAKRPPLIADGERAVLLLRPQPGLTYVTEHLGPGVFYTTVSGRAGVLQVGSDAEVEAIERALADGQRIAGLDGEAAAAARRELAFAELASPSPALVADALAELQGLPALAPLMPQEREAIGRALHDRRVLPATRVRLLELVAARKMTDALPTLAATEADTPEVLQALLRARAALGAPATRAELARYLEADDTAVRSAAVRALAELGDAGALTDVEHYALTDRDVGVRAAAVEALGERREPKALPVLSRTFDASEAEVRTASARAMLKIDGPATDDTLVDLALRGNSNETRTYAALILMILRGRDHPSVQRLEQSQPSPEVRAVIEHGLEFRETHHHD
jgi:HEAT repeat protein